jgi:DNA polymerase III subunit epsilon
MYLFFDIETTGLPKVRDASITNLKNWPRMVQLAWLQYDKNQNLISEANYIIKPEGFTIQADAFKVHGITTEKALESGVHLETFLQEFSELYYHLFKKDFEDAHNAAVDVKACVECFFELMRVGSIKNL